MPFVGKFVDGLGVIEPRPEVVPAEADATEDDGTAFAVAELGAPDLQLSVAGDRRL